MIEFKTQARRSIGLLDLTDLNDDCAETDIDDLARRAVTPYGNVAALCVWPRWIKRAKEAVSGTGVRIATVTNFPTGLTSASQAASETAAAISAGADEVDLVLDYRALLAGDVFVAAEVVAASRREVPPDRILKIIIESGELHSRGHILLASLVALDGGADFIKTSTGKVAINATSFAAEIMLGAIRRGNYAAGFKAAGGIKTTQDAVRYLQLADGMMGDGWVSPDTFRFGASGVLADLVATLDGTCSVKSSGY